MTLRLGDLAPDFIAETTQGTIRFHHWVGNDWAMLFSHPKDFTPVCTTELGALAKLKSEFDKRGCKIMGLSEDSLQDHRRWSKDIAESQGASPDFPLIADRDLSVVRLFGMLPSTATGDSSERTASDNAPVRSVFLIGPDKKIKLMISYPMSTGRDFREILRALDSCQLTSSHQVATPANWQVGEDVIILPSLSNEQAKQFFPGGWRTPKSYIRFVPYPKQ